MRRIMMRVASLSCLMFCSIGVASQTQQEVRELVSGAAVERELAGGEAHVYRIEVATGEYLHVTIAQRGIDVVGVLRGPDGVQLIEMDEFGGTLGAEELSCEAASGGGHTLEVKARARSGNPGRYEVKLEKRREATVKDRARVAAERLLMEGRRAHGEGQGEALERAIRKYGEAVEKWQEAGEQKWEARTLQRLGVVYYYLSQFEKARDRYNQALVISREIKDRHGEGSTLNSLGGVYNALSEYEKARGYYEEALAISREINDRRGEGATLNSLGVLYINLSQYEKARNSYEQALLIGRETKNKRDEGMTLNNLGNFFFYLSQYEKARDYHERSLAIWRELKSKFGEGMALSNLGAVYESLSQHEMARDTLEQVLAITREIKDKQGEGETLNNLGEVYESLNENETARDYLEQALTIRREVKDKRGEGLTLNNLAEFYLRLGQNEKARACFEQALAIRRKIGDSVGEAETLFSVASIERQSGNLSGARKQIESALVIVESLRAHYTDPQLRATYFATTQNSYEFYIDLLMRLHKQHPAAGHDAAALHAAERAHARSLLDTLAEAGADIRQGVDPQLVERERSLQRQLNSKAQQQMTLLGGEHTAEQAADSAREIESLTREYQQIQAEIRRTSPRYAALTQPQPLSVREIQQQVLDTGTLLLEYALGDERSYVWAVTTNSISSHELPKRSEVETASRRVYELLKTSHRRESQRAAELAITELSRMLLGPVAGQLGKKRLLIVGDGALQYVPFAVLLVPERDTEKGRRGDTEKGGRGDTANKSLTDLRVSGTPLIANHEIVSLPSASVLAVLRRELSGRKPAPKALAVLADPVFRADDLRVRQAGMGGTRSAGRASANAKGERVPDGDLTRSARESGISGFERLRFTREEAEAIVVQARDRDSLKALDFDADRSTVMNGRLDEYRIVHFATHGLLNSQHPELSGIVLSLVDEQGRPQDGFLRAHDIYNLKLRAELVVLSACQTALGKEIKGEGLAGLTRGFMYAGAERVVASLWDVKDEATAELMKRFYRGMLRGGLRPSAALRAAQISMWKEPRWGAPYYWAGFMLQGEWR